MLITFARDGRGSTVATIHRGDSVVLELPGYDRKYRVPHDLAHAVTESELGMAEGVFGSIAGGGVFGNMRVVAGRPRHDAADRSRRLLAANKRALGVAEMLAGVVHAAVEHGRTAAIEGDARRAWGMFGTEPFPWTTLTLTAAVDRLAALTTGFARTGELTFTWPDRLTSRVPAPAPTHRGRRGRL
jgi:hypothetical protein